MTKERGRREDELGKVVERGGEKGKEKGGRLKKGSGEYV